MVILTRLKLCVFFFHYGRGGEGNKLEIDLNLLLTLVWAKVGGVIKK